MTGLASQSLADLGHILHGDLSVTGTVTPAGDGESYAITGVYASPYDAASFSSVDVAAAAPRLVCLASEAAAVAAGDAITLPSGSYRIVDVEYTGSGATILHLVTA